MKNTALSKLNKEKGTLIIGILLSIGLFLFYLLFCYIPMYSTDMQLFVRNIPINNIVTEEEHAGASIQSESGFSNPLFNLTTLLTSRALADKVYDTLQAKHPNDLKTLNVKSRADWYDKYPKLIQAKIIPTTDIIQVSFNWVNNKSANNVLSVVIDEFKQTNINIRRASQTQKRQYLDSQIADISTKLDNIRKKIKDYRLAHRAVDLDNESSELIRARVDLQRQAELLRSEVSYNNKKLSNLSSQLNFPNAGVALRATAIGADPYLIKLNQDLVIAQQNYAKLKAKFKDAYPDVIAAKNEITAIRKHIIERRRESLGNLTVQRGIYDQSSQDIVTDMARIQAERASSVSRLRTLESGIQNLLRKESTMPAKYLGLQELQKQENVLAMAYESAKQKQLDAAIKEHEIVDNIIPLGQSSEPKFMFITLFIRLFVFLALGVFGSLGIAWVKEDFRENWANAKEIELVTNKKVLGIIPWVKSGQDIPEGYTQEPHSLMGITYRSITANIISKSYLEEAQVLSFISTVSSRSNSTIVSNISATLAKLDKSVILVDTDFTRSAKLLRDLNVNTSMDLIDAINEINKHYRLNKTISSEMLGQIIMESLIPINLNGDDRETGFYYLCANKQVNNIYDYIATRGFTAILNFLKQHNEFVLIETPAVPLVFPEISVITGVSDAVIIISAMETNKEGLTQVIDTLDKSHTKVLGIISREENSEIEEYFAIRTADITQDQKV